jgi:site-specific DNA-adenine methylase
MRNQFFITYFGNKYQESKKHLKYETYNDIEHIIEPYGGTYGFSRFIYEMDEKTGRKPRKFSIYDNNTELIDFYTKLKKMTAEEFKTYVDGYNDIMNDKKYRSEKKPNCIDNKKIKTIIDEHPDYKFMIERNTDGGMAKTTNKKNCNLFFDMLKHCEFINENCKNLKLADEHNTLVYLDPPYILSCNLTYSDPGFDHSQFIHLLFQTLKKSKVMFIHSGHYLLDLVFKPYIIDTYEKTYSLTKRKIIHNIYKS